MKCELVGILNTAKQQCVKNGKCWGMFDVSLGKTKSITTLPISEEMFNRLDEGTKIKITIETIE